MDINHKIRWLRISYWAGAIADFLMVILFLIPERMGEVEYRHSMGLAASLMLGWTLSFPIVIMQKATWLSIPF